ncbi:MAG TPA: dihydrolipoyllysine-residue acetyltransferase, partial [Pirellulales bacterium]|nr:dihydrolipoyllysine-residue acetyltransferase [Pirellulales bacterium]
MSTIEVKVPDIGGFSDVPVIDVLVKAGDTVAVEDSLVTLESDKATMDVPSPAAGKVGAMRIKVGDKVSEGSVLLMLDSDAPSAKDSPASVAGTAPATTSAPPTPALVTPAPRGEEGRADTPGEGSSATPPAGATIEVRVPDIGDFTDIPVIEVFVKPGDIVKPDDPLVTLESDKATMDVPAPVGGTVEGVRVSVGARVSEGTPLLSLKTAQTGPEPASRATPPMQPANADRAVPPIERTTSPIPAPPPSPQSSPTREGGTTTDEGAFRSAHASPSVRKFARELGVDLGKVTGSGPKGRILQENVQQFVKGALAGATAGAAPAGAGVSGSGLNLLPWPKVDFAKFGAVETKPLSRIKKISGANLARNWVMVPHVTQFDDADITDLEPFRVALNKENEKAGVKVTMLAFLITASVAALRKFPDFNASLDATGENLVYKKYFNIGFAADTPNGLVVPVLKGADQKGVLQIAKEMAELSAKARDGKLGPADMQGGCFSISSLGGIGGTAFTPIVNAPEVAILGVSRSAMKPVWDGKAFVPRLML